MTANINPQTFVPYGVIYANDLDSDLFASLLYDNSTDMDFEEQMQTYAIDNGYDSDDTDLDHSEWLEGNNLECDWDTSENYHEGEYEGVKFGITSFGGAHLVYVYQSPYVQDYIACSPCIPNAHNIDVSAAIRKPDTGQWVDNSSGYCVPPSWLYSGSDNQ